MRLGELRYGGVAAWPPAWTSALPNGRFLTGNIEATLVHARRRGAGVDIEVAIDGASYHGLLLWDGEPNCDEVIRVLQGFVGRPLSDAASAVIRFPETRRSA